MSFDQVPKIMENDIEQVLFGGKYNIIAPIEREVFVGYDVHNQDIVAVKLEPKSISGRSLLANESEVYKQMRGIPGIPQCRLFGSTYEYDYLVLDMLGQDIGELSEICKGFTLKTILMLADQMIERIEQIHNKGFIHRDIKPQNFAIGMGEDCNKVFIFDFGAIKKYKNKRNQSHLPTGTDQNWSGTTMFSSLNSDLRIRGSRRDDMESLGYSLIFLMNGNLPWCRHTWLERIVSDVHDLMRSKKKCTTIETLCEGLPAEFAEYLTICRGLKFDEEPDYEHLREMFRKLFYKSNFEDDNMFDWNEKDRSKKKHKSWQSETDFDRLLHLLQDNNVSSFDD